MPRNASWSLPGALPGMRRVPSMPGTRCDEDEDCVEQRPLWQAVILAVVNGLAAGAAPTLVTYVLHKVDPELFGDKDEEEPDAE